MKTTLTELRSENYDLIIDLHNNIRSFWLKFRLRVNSFTVCKRNGNIEFNGPPGKEKERTRT